MQAPSPHFLLYSEASASDDSQPRWRFVLQPIGGDKFLAADEAEPGVSGNRLELLAVVRGLEALEQPSRVTLLTSSRYVNRGIRRCLGQWRERKWRWERFGQLVPIRNQDLWQRLDRAMQFHQLECWPASLAEQTAHDAKAVAVAGDLNAQVEFPAAETASPESEMLNVNRRHSAQLISSEPQVSQFFWTLNRLRRGVLAPLAVIWRPAFTRAA